MTLDARARDADLVAALARGERAAAFDQLVQRYTPRLYRLSWLLLRDSARAEDAVQDSLLRAWRALDGYDATRGALSTWLYTITRHHCLAQLGRPALDTLSLDEPDGEALAASLAQPESGPADARATLQALIDTLPETPRACLQLFYWEDRSVAEVAAQLGLPDNTVKTHLHRARARLRQALADQGLDDPALWL